MLVRFWTDTCSFCARTAPALSEFEKAYSEKGLVVIGIYHPKPHGRRVSDEEVAKAAKELGMNFPIAIDEDWKFLDSVWLETGHDRAATSASFLIDRDGIIRYVHPGVEFFQSERADERNANRDYEDIKKAIELLVAEPPKKK